MPVLITPYLICPLYENSDASFKWRTLNWTGCHFSEVKPEGLYGRRPQSLCLSVLRRHRKRLLYPDVQTIEWVQCCKCKGWRHTDCAGLSHPHLRAETFCCGCDASNTCNRTIELLDVHGVQGLLSTDEIKVIIRILEKCEGFSCYQAECAIASGIKFTNKG
ncbi:probable histone acetyltransferase HAC-like 3 [Anguilla anguilla]|uniref:probable histone acetyltransferase HAC-like 3 n=1 Tax=Anguilla anguilla TaxID=7936 RepID=UPI0015AB2E17|nr:probable histone acetyltransferase HAC-like 3 [Anguilla anguilla]